jgi:D-hexose-6-phosphate mutarotase
MSPVSLESRELPRREGLWTSQCEDLGSNAFRGGVPVGA